MEIETFQQTRFEDKHGYLMLAPPLIENAPPREVVDAPLFTGMFVPNIGLNSLFNLRQGSHVTNFVCPSVCLSVSRKKTNFKVKKF